MRAGFKFLGLLLLGLTSASISMAQNGKSGHKSIGATPDAKGVFASSCAACHGLDGKGSERAPNIADGANVRRMTHAQLFKVIQNGIPGTGMPAFHTLSSHEIDALISHLSTLAGSGKAVALPGDPAAGQVLFSGKAGCSQCHMVSGQGGFIASELSDYGRGHSAEQIRSAIVNSASSPSGSVREATVALRDGEKFSGRIRNEDNFSIQLEDLAGVFHLLPRSDVLNLTYSEKSMMPSDFGTTLTPKELDDVVSYLMSAAQSSDKAKTDKRDGKDCGPFCADEED